MALVQAASIPPPDKTAQHRDGPDEIDHAFFSEFGQEPEADALVDCNKDPARQAA